MDGVRATLPASALVRNEIASFIDDGFVKLERAFDRAVGEQCRHELWARTGYDPQDPATWADSLVRIDGMATAAFTAAATTPRLHAAFDMLVGVGRWQPRLGLGTFPLRFPSDEPAREAGWHVEASFAGDAGEPRINLRSRGRALLMLFLFSEIGPDDAPTLIRVGSHLRVPPMLTSAGESGCDWMSLCAKAVPATEDLDVVAATGSVGDVYLCHPFLVHSGQAHRGRVPRFMAQPPLEPIGEIDEASPVAAAIRRGLDQA